MISLDDIFSTEVKRLDFILYYFISIIIIVIVIVIIKIMNLNLNYYYKKNEFEFGLIQIDILSVFSKSI
jgi:hypothetical protein